MDQPVRIPVDIDLEDRLIGRLTARQTAILAAGAIPVYLLWTLHEHLGWVGFALLAVPLAGLALALAFGRFDDLALDRLAVAALRERLAARVRRPDPDVHPDTGDLRADTVGPDGRLLGRAVRAASPTRVVRGALSGGGLGVVEVRSASGRRVEALAVIAEVAPVNLALRSPGEQDALIAGFAQWLHTLAAPVQLLSQSHPVDVAMHVAGLHHAAHRLPPGLAVAAVDHATHLARHAGARDATEHHSYLVFTAPTHNPATSRTTGTGPAGLAPGLTSRRPPSAGRRRADALGLRGHPSDHYPGSGSVDSSVDSSAEASHAERDNTTTRVVEDALRRRLADAHSVLGAAGITLTVLDTSAVAALVAHSTHTDATDLTDPADLTDGAGLTDGADLAGRWSR